VTPHEQDAQELHELAGAFTRLSEWAHRTASSSGTQEVVALLRDHLGGEGVDRSVIGRELPPYEHVNLQVALEYWSAREDGTSTSAA
jgi:hypothetical protein